MNDQFHWLEVRFLFGVRMGTKSKWQIFDWRSFECFRNSQYNLNEPLPIEKQQTREQPFLCESRSSGKSFFLCLFVSLVSLFQVNFIVYLFSPSSYSSSFEQRQKQYNTTLLNLTFMTCFFFACVCFDIINKNIKWQRTLRAFRLTSDRL